jgi:D-alanyl-D-alanine dipeptidase
LGFTSCSNRQENNTIHTVAIANPNELQKVREKDTSQLERYLISKNLVNIHSLDTNIRVALHYASSQNFLKKPIYLGLQNCYLPCEVAIKLCNAQMYLKEQFPLYNLIAFDAVRPLHIQQQMWDELEMPVEQKINYLAHPSSISLHNYGAAVDVGLIGEDNVLLDMGTTFDYFGDLSQPKKELRFYKEGKLSKQALANRLLLRQVMLKAGFTIIATEWWHFNSTNKTIAAQRYELIQ